MSKPTKYQTRGHVLAHNLFVSRPEFAELLMDLAAGEEFATVNAPRSSGKTSLLKAIQREFEGKGFRTAYLDWRTCTPDSSVVDKGKWIYTWLMEGLAEEFGLNGAELRAWLEDIRQSRSASHADALIAYFKQFLRPRLEGRLLVLIDETEVLRRFGDLADHFLDAINRLNDEKESLRLSIILAGIYPSHFLMSASRRPSDFKQDKTIMLQDFGQESAKEWSAGINGNETISKLILDTTGGHPYLTGLLHEQIQNQDDEIDEQILEQLVPKLIREAKKADTVWSHFLTPRDFIKENKDVGFAALEIYEAILAEKAINQHLLQGKPFQLLLAAGLVKTERETAISRCEIYRSVFDQKWIKEMRLLLGASPQELSRNRYLKGEVKKIALLNLGGTLGMVERNGQVLPPEDEEEFFDNYGDLRQFADITYTQLEVKDGANIFPKDWSILAQAIFDRRNEGFDGFVVAMGTDTMQYAASAVAYALGEGLNFPVVFVGAQATHTAFYGDALINLYRAIRVASEPIPEVLICFNKDVFRAVRAQKISDHSFDGFASPTYLPIATITESINVRKDLIRGGTKGRIKLINTFEDNILPISQHPGLQASFFMQAIESGMVKGVLFESLGIGNITNTGGKYDLMPIVRTAVERNIPVIIASRYPIEPKFIHKYVPAMAPIQLGAIHALNMASSAALTKLMWLLPQVEKDIQSGDLLEKNKLDEIKRLMEFSFVGEVDKVEES